MLKCDDCSQTWDPNNNKISTWNHATFKLLFSEILRAEHCKFTRTKLTKKRRNSSITMAEIARE